MTTNTVNHNQTVENPSLTIRRPCYNISVDNLEDWYINAYHRTYATQNPAVIEEFHAQLADVAHAGYAAGGKSDETYQADYQLFMQENGRNIGQQPEEIRRLSHALAQMTLLGLEYHRHAGIWQYELYVDFLGVIFTDPAWQYANDQTSIRVFLHELKACAARV